MRKRNKSSLRKVVSLGLCTVMLLTACGKTKTPATENTETPGGSVAAEPATSPSEAPAPAADAGLHNLEDGVLDIGTSIKWDSLTPFRSQVANNAPWAAEVYETLARLTYDKEYVPVVAKSWEGEDDGVTFNIEIYDYVYDAAGNHITAEDIVWMIESNMEAALKPSFGKVESVEQTGEYTLKVVMKQDMVGAFEQILTGGYVISKASYEADKDGFATGIVSTAPYTITEFTPGATMTLERREDYWQKPELIHPSCSANVQTIKYHTITEASQSGIALETGTLDGFITLDHNTVAQFEGNDKFTYVATPFINGSQMFFSGHDSRSIANDVNLRQAICYAIDAQGLLNAVYAGYGQTMKDPIADTSVGWLEKWRSEDYYEYDPVKAEEFLKASGYNGEELILLGGSSSQMQRLAQMIQSYLMAVGINVKLNLVDQALLTSIRLDGSQYDMFINTVGGDMLPDHWSIRYDMNAYKTGDGTARHDEALAELLYSTWTREGFTEENIDKVHIYLKDNMYAYGMVQPSNVDIWRSDLGMTEEIRISQGSHNFAACSYQE